MGIAMELAISIGLGIVSFFLGMFSAFFLWGTLSFVLAAIIALLNLLHTARTWLIFLMYVAVSLICAAASLGLFFIEGFLGVHWVFFMGIAFASLFAYRLAPKFIAVAWRQSRGDFSDSD